MTLQVSHTTALITVACLCLSVAVHLVQLALYWPGKVALHEMLSSGGGSDAFSEVPIALRPAALTTVKSHRFGLHANLSAFLPSGRGAIYIPSRDQHAFVAHYHQLHCLDALRDSFNHRHELDEAQVRHVDHCFMYLQQALLCNVDTTLEPATHIQKTFGGRIVKVATGFGVIHRCRDWTQLRDYMESRYVEWISTYKEMSESAPSGA